MALSAGSTLFVNKYLTCAPFVDFANAAALASAILIERRIEFLAEGLAGFDLTRLGLPLPAKASVAAVQASQQEYIWPI